MNKRNLKTYINSSDKPILMGNCFKYDDSYLISDKYSIIKLNDNYTLNVIDNNDILSRFMYDFENNYEKQYNLVINYELDNQSIVNDDKGNSIFGVNIKMVKRIKSIINFNAASVLRKYSFNDYTFLIKLENTNTNEVAYLLPTRVY